RYGHVTGVQTCALPIYPTVNYIRSSSSTFAKLRHPDRRVVGRLRPNKRLKLAGPAFRGGVRLCANDLVPQGGELAPTGVRPAARSEERREGKRGGGGWG